MKRSNILLVWFLSLTWGVVLSFVGAFIALILIMSAHKPKIFHCFVYFEVGNNKVGTSIGCFFFVGKKTTLKTKQHEAGHCLQNALFGIFQVVIAICSGIRYQYRNFIKKKFPQKAENLPAYDAIWFESLATKFGKKYFN